MKHPRIREVGKGLYAIILGFFASSGVSYSLLFLYMERYYDPSTSAFVTCVLCVASFVLFVGFSVLFWDMLVPSRRTK